MTYAEFMATADEATKARYAATLAEMDTTEYRSATHFEYAEALTFWGLLERHVERLYTGKHLRGSRTKHRLAQEVADKVDCPIHGNLGGENHCPRC